MKKSEISTSVIANSQAKSTHFFSEINSSIVDWAAIGLKTMDRLQIVNNMNLISKNSNIKSN
jgi:hypothetical protein